MSYLTVKLGYEIRHDLVANLIKAKRDIVYEQPDVDWALYFKVT